MVLTCSSSDGLMYTLEYTVHICSVVKDCIQAVLFSVVDVVKDCTLPTQQSLCAVWSRHMSMTTMIDSSYSYTKKLHNYKRILLFVLIDPLIST